MREVAVNEAGVRTTMLAVRACVDSYWMKQRSVAALLSAGASDEGVALPTGYPEIDALLGGTA